LIDINLAPRRCLGPWIATTLVKTSRYFGRRKKAYTPDFSSDDRLLESRHRVQLARGQWFDLEKAKFLPRQSGLIKAKFEP